MTQLGDTAVKRTGGGAATSAGVEFQNRVATWLAVRILAESEAQALWDWPAGSALKILRCETEQPVDDILVATSDSDVAYIQVKRSITGAIGHDTPLGSVFSQFVRQFLRPATCGATSYPWDRQFDPCRDRLVLAMGKDASDTITVDARDVLIKVRQGADIAALGFNLREKAALALIRGHLEMAWKAATGNSPTEADVMALLRATYFEVIDAESQGAAERQAKELLRRSVLEQAAHADLAWAKIFEICTGFSRTRGGADHTDLIRTLATSGLALKIAPSYRSDVQKLRIYTEQTIKILAKFADIRVGGSIRVKIERDSTKALREAVGKTSLLVIGEPGAGKSGALHDLAKMLLQEQQPVVCLATDEVAATSIPELTRELNLEHSLVEVLANWGNAGRPVYFVTDALDAARTDHAGEMFRNLIEGALELGSASRVVASIRMFDLRNDGRLRALFAGAPDTRNASMEFAGTRHFRVPLLAEPELKALAKQSKPFEQLVQAVLDGANAEMRGLIAFPFNLRLLGELVGEGASVDSLKPIRTQLELLDRYWRERVLRPGKDRLGDARETVLRKVARAMFGSRLLHAPRSVIDADTRDSEILHDLLSAEILQENRPGTADGQGRETLKFPHHLLFDYALARLLFRIRHPDLANLIADDPDCVVAFRPSLTLHSQHLWEADPAQHAEFWALVFQLHQHPAIPRVGKIVGPVVAVDQFRLIGDFAPFFDKAREALATDDSRKMIGEVTTYITGAIAAKGGIRHTGETADAVRWAEFATELAKHIEALAYPLRHLLLMLCDTAESIPEAAKPKIGEAGRAVLDFALKRDDRYDSGFVRVAIVAIARTCSTAPEAARTALARLLEAKHVANYGHKELFFFAQEVPHLLPHIPELVGQLYRTAFTAAKDSDEKTFVGGPSRILPLISNVRQDWDSVQYSLAQFFPRMMATAAGEGVGAALAAVASYVEQNHSRRLEPLPPGRFQFLGHDATISTDYSAIWDAEGAVASRSASAMSLLAGITQHLGQLDAQGDDAVLVELLGIIATEARHAVVWRRVLRVAAQHPARLGKLVSELARRDAVLACFDTHEAVGALLKAVYQHLSSAERTEIENTVLAFPLRADARKNDAQLRDRYLGCLPYDLVATDGARQRLAELDRTGGPPPNMPHFRMTGFEDSIVSDEEFLRYRGVEVDEPANRRLLELIDPLKTTFAKGGAQPPATEDPATRLQRLHDLKSALEDKTVDGEIRRQAYAHMAEACSAALKAPADASQVALKEFARGTLLETVAAMKDGPLETDEQFDRMPGWSSPHALIAAAEGFLLSNDELPPPIRAQVDAAIDRLALSTEPEVRFQIARYAGSYAQTNQQRMWTLLCAMADRDPSTGVLTAVLATVSHSNAPEAMELFERIFARSKELRESESIRESCLGYFLSLHLYNDSEKAWSHLQPLANDPGNHAKEAERVIRNLRDAVTFGAISPEIAEQNAVRQRGQRLLARILEAAGRDLSAHLAKYVRQTAASVPEEAKERIQLLQQLVQAVADQIYFASGAFDERASKNENQKLESAKRERFWREMKGIIRTLSSSKVPSVSHHLIETLGSLVSFEPKAVFIEISRAVQCGKEGGFQFESLVAELAVKVVKEFIAAHRSLLREDKECRRALIEVLDTFVEAGWPAAQQLTYGLEDIFR